MSSTFFDAPKPAPADAARVAGAEQPPPGRSEDGCSPPQGADALLRERGPANKAHPNRGRFSIERSSRLGAYTWRFESAGRELRWLVAQAPTLDPRMLYGARLDAHGVHDASMRLPGAHDVSTRLPGAQSSGPDSEDSYRSRELWDHGTWWPIDDIDQGLRRGRLHIGLRGGRLDGEWVFFRAPDVVASTRAGPGLTSAGRWLLRQRGRIGVGRVAQACAQRRAALIDSSIARWRPLPASLFPQRPSWADRPPLGPMWTYQSRLDGQRLLARVDDAGVRLFTRNGLDATLRWPQLARAIGASGLSGCWLDGQLGAVDAAGRVRGATMQDAGTDALAYFVFDLPWWRGRDIRPLSLAARQKCLAELFAGIDPHGPLRRVESYPGAAGLALLEAACRLGLPGVIAKRLHAPYEPGRTLAWLKLSCRDLMPASSARPNGRA